MNIKRGLHFGLLMMGCLFISNGVVALIITEPFKLTKVLLLIPAGLLLVAIAYGIRRKYNLNKMD